MDVMSDLALLEEAVTLALKLTPKERLQLIERVASSVEREIDTKPHNEEHWGQALNRLMETLDMSAWNAPEFDDPTEWLRKQREQELKQRLGDWGETE